MTTKRIREGYWSLFACVALDTIEGKDHFLYFPSEPSSDVRFLSENDFGATRPKMNALVFDVKEYTNYSSPDGFDSFIRKTIVPGRAIYGIIVGVSFDIDHFDISSLFCSGEDRGVFLIYAENKDSTDPLRAKVLFVHRDKIVFNQSINLADRIKPMSSNLVFQDRLRDVPSI